MHGQQAGLQRGEDLFQVDLRQQLELPGIQRQAPRAQGDLLARDIISGVGNHVGRILAIMVNLFNPQKILIGSPFNLAADILFPAISSCIRQQSLPAYSQHIAVESTQFSNRGTMAGAALVKDALYNGSLLIRLLQG